MMNGNFKMAKELVGLARELVSSESSVPYSFVLTCVEKVAVVDDYEDGETGHIVSTCPNIVVSDRSLKECVEKAADLIGADYRGTGDIVIDDSLITMGTMETDDGVLADRRDVEQWKNGQRRLWACDYVWTVTMRLDKECSAEFIESELKKN